MRAVERNKEKDHLSCLRDAANSSYLPQTLEKRERGRGRRDVNGVEMQGKGGCRGREWKAARVGERGGGMWV